MNDFKDVLDQVRRDRSDLFEPAALEDPDEDDLTVEASDFEVPDRKDLERREQIDRPPDLPLEQNESDDWWDLDDESDDFERDTSRAREERESFQGRPRRASIELLAVYLPFHL